MDWMWNVGAVNQIQIKVNFEAAIWLLDIFLVFSSIWRDSFIIVFTINKGKARNLEYGASYRKHIRANTTPMPLWYMSIFILIRYIWTVKSALMGVFLLLYLYFGSSSAIEKHNLFFIYNFVCFLLYLLNMNGRRMVYANISIFARTWDVWGG